MSKETLFFSVKQAFAFFDAPPLTLFVVVVVQEEHGMCGVGDESGLGQEGVGPGRQGEQQIHPSPSPSSASELITHLVQFTSLQTDS